MLQRGEQWCVRARLSGPAPVFIKVGDGGENSFFFWVVKHLLIRVCSRLYHIHTVINQRQCRCAVV